MRVIAFYLPQFHEIPENNKWWGEGFTEWKNMKQSKPLYPGHYQPRVPLNNNYYSLDDINILKWQSRLAKEYNVHGFCFYHYWFNGKLLLEKPVEKFLNDKSIDINFCLSWANETWTRSWASKKDEILIEQNYGSKKEWEKHFYYLLPFFNDKRYIKNNNKPVFVIYRPEQIEKINEMIDYWQELAKQNNLPGISFVYQQVDYYLSKDGNKPKFDYRIEYQPSYAFTLINRKTLKTKIRKVVSKTLARFEKIFKTELRSRIKQDVKRYNYDDVWNFILKQRPDHKAIPCAFVDWDNTPRRSNRGTSIDGASPDKFKYYYELLYKKTMKYYETDLLFVFAWNEWAEGGYLEPDSKYEYGYLKAIKDVHDKYEI